MVNYKLYNRGVKSKFSLNNIEKKNIDFNFSNKVSSYLYMMSNMVYKGYLLDTLSSHILNSGNKLKMLSVVKLSLYMLKFDLNSSKFLVWKFNDNFFDVNMCVSKFFFLSCFIKKNIFII